MQLLLAIGFTFVITLLGVSALEINGYLRYSHYRTPSSHVKVACNADEPLEECQFMNHATGLSIQLKNNLEFKDAFQKGICETQMGVLMTEHFVIGCRVRTKTSKWVYQEMLMFLSEKEEFPYSLTETRMVVEKDASVVVMGKSGLPLSKCQFRLPGETELISFNEGRDTNTSYKDNYEYYGQGLGKGDCGITIKSLENSGFLYSYVETNATVSVHSSSDFITLIAAGLDDPVLTMDYYYLNGEDLNATCTARGSPAPNMKWLLGDNVVRSDDMDDSLISDAWSWSYDVKNITQILSLNLTKENDREYITCSIGHSMLSEDTVEERQRIYMHYIPGSVLYGTILGVVLLLIIVGTVYGYFTRTLCFTGSCYEFYVRRIRR